MGTIDADYLVIGAGATAMAFVDTLVSETSATVVVVDRNHRPGGHWTTAYPFVRLHQPSAYYGVNSRPLGNDTIDTTGLNKGFFELAAGAEVCSYFDAVMQQQLLPTGQVSYFPLSEYLGDGRFRTSGGDDILVHTRRRIVDTTFVGITVPSMRPPPYDVAPDVDCVPPNDLPACESHDSYVVVGAGKTAMDTCLWLLRHGVGPERLTWIKPRDAWLLNRANVQPGPQFAKQVLADVSAQLKAVQQAESVNDLFARLSDAGSLMRIDDVDRTADVPLRDRVGCRTGSAATNRQRGADGTRKGHRTGPCDARRRDAADRGLGALHRLHRSGSRSRRRDRRVRRRPNHPADGAHLPAGLQRGAHRARRSSLRRR